MEDITTYGSYVNNDQSVKTYIARILGRSHESNGLPCQDYCYYDDFEHQAVICAVGDGHGDPKCIYSDLGSMFACHSTAIALERYLRDHRNCQEKDLVEYLTGTSYKSAVFSIFRELVMADYEIHKDKEHLQAVDILIKYGTTLLFTITTNNYYICGQIGDGAILLFQKDTDKAEQFAKRSLPKSDTTTDSMCSMKHNVFYIAAYSRNYFDTVLMTSDGIYDVLDKPGSFRYYADSLLKQISSSGTIKDPFVLENINISSYSLDDMTMALISAEKPAKVNTHEAASLLEYEFTNLNRCYKDTIMLEAVKDQKKALLRIYDRLDMNDTKDTELKYAHIRKYLSSSELLGCRCDIYDQESYKDLEQLMEEGYFTEPKIRTWTDPETRKKAVWQLKVFENVISLFRELKDLGLGLTYDGLRSIQTDANGQLYIFPDGIVNRSEQTDYEAEQFLDKFGIIGKLSCGTDKEWPLYRCEYWGPVIPELHLALKDDVSLASIIKNPDKEMFALRNLSGKQWITSDNSVIDPFRIFPLKKKIQSFTFTTHEKGICLGTDISQHDIRYTVTLMR